MDCVLCQARETEGFRIVHQDDLVFVMVNIEPIKDGHVMVLPVRHVAEPGELNAAEAKAFLGAVSASMAMVDAAYKEPPMTLINGLKYRTQPGHLHAHVLPSAHDSRGLYVAAEGVPERVRASRDTLTEMTERFKKHFVV